MFGKDGATDERQASALVQALAFAQKLKASAASGTIDRASPASGMFGRSINGASQGLVSPGHAGEQYDDPTVRNLKSQTQQLIDKYCGPVPPTPPGTSVDDNMGLARRRAFVESFPAHIYDMYKDSEPAARWIIR